MNKNTISTQKFGFTRRNFLRGLGVGLALPALESVLKTSSFAAAGAPNLATTSSGAPLRTAFVYFPNGAIHKNWWPEGSGRDFKFNKTMEALEPLKHQVQVFGGLDHVNATAGPDGAGDHARANGTFLTGVRVKKTAGADIHAGISIDQIIADQVGHLTRFPSLELTCDAVRKSGNCDSGYSCAYQHNLSWRSPTNPVAPEPNPRLVFERLFGAGSQGERSRSLEQRRQQQRSILDFVLEDARDLGRELASRDRHKLDEYLTSVRDLEKRIERSEQFKDIPDPNVDTPAGIPRSYSEHMNIMFEMMLLAFQTDSTRIATFLLAGDGNNRAFPEIGVPEGHHHLSHHQNREEMIEKVAAIDRWYMEQFAKFLLKMEQTKDIDGKSLLHNSMIVYGCRNSDGNRHTHHNLPIVVAGGGGGTITPGRYADAGGKPMCNLFLSMADRFGVQGLDRFGDSTARLSDV